MGPRTIDRLLSSGTWDRMYSGVYRISGTPPSWRQALLAATLAWGNGAVISHRAAAALWRFPGFIEGEIELSVPRSRRRAYQHLTHRPVSLLRVDVATREAIPITTATRTLIDVAGAVPSAMLEEALDDALHRRLATVARIRRRLRDLAGPGRSGRWVLAGLLDTREGTSGVPQSVFETRLLRTLREAGLPPPRIQQEVQTDAGSRRLDLAYPERRIAIEADGFRWHSSRMNWDRLAHGATRSPRSDGRSSK
jgi:hypothetical protein